MLNNILKDGKGILIFLLMFIIFAYFAIIRVDHLEKSSLNHEVSKEVVYNK